MKASRYLLYFGALSLLFCRRDPYEISFLSKHDARCLIVEFHLGYAPSLTTKILPEALREFKQAHPLVLIKLHDLSTEEMLIGLREKQLNAALLVKPLDSILGSLIYAEITRFRPCVAMPCTHPLAASEALTAQSLADERFIAYNLFYYPEHRSWLRQVFKGANISRIVAECDSFSSLIAAVEFGDGIELSFMKDSKPIR